MSFNREIPYNNLPLLPPNVDLYNSIEVYKELSHARAALAELKGRAPVIPNPLMLINTLVLQEARDSSTIENIVTSRDKLFRGFASQDTVKDKNIKEVLRYREALWQAFQLLNKTKIFDLSLIVQIFQIIKQTKEGIRNQQVYIVNGSSSIYTPPEPGKVLMKKLENLIEFINSTNSADPLIKMAILHYQFESIHPFPDGNGRTGRIINVVYLTFTNLLDLPILYLSKYILENKPIYYNLFKEVTETNNWKNWIIFMLRAVEETSRFTLQKVNAIHTLFDKVVNEVRTKAPGIYSHELIEIIFSQPYSKIELLVSNNIASRNTASKYLKRLVEMDILQEHKVGKELLYLNKELYKILAQP